MIENTIKAIVFDFDLTLADSRAASAECINFALREMGLEMVSNAEAHKCIGHPLPEIFSRVAGCSDESAVEEFAALFRQRADVIMTQTTSLYEGVHEALHMLLAANLRMGIVSTKSRPHFEDILRRENVLDCFDALIGGLDITSYKPNPEGLLEVIRRIGSDVDRTLYVGDHVIDAQTAKNANVPFVAVLTGTTKREDFNGYPVRAFLDSMTELPVQLGISMSS